MLMQLPTPLDCSSITLRLAAQPGAGCDGHALLFGGQEIGDYVGVRQEQFDQPRVTRVGKHRDIWLTSCCFSTRYNSLGQSQRLDPGRRGVVVDCNRPHDFHLPEFSRLALTPLTTGSQSRHAGCARVA